MIKRAGDRERVRKRENGAHKKGNEPNKQTNQNDLWNFFGSLAKMQGICGNLLELYLLYKIVANQKKNMAFVCYFILPTNRSIALSWHKTTE